MGLVASPGCTTAAANGTIPSETNDGGLREDSGNRRLAAPSSQSDPSRGGPSPESLVGIGAGIVATEIKNDPIVPQAFDAQARREVRGRLGKFILFSVLSTGLEKFARNQEPGELRSGALVGAGLLRVAGGAQAFALGGLVTGVGLTDLGIGIATGVISHEHEASCCPVFSRA